MSSVSYHSILHAAFIPLAVTREKERGKGEGATWAGNIWRCSFYEVKSARLFYHDRTENRRGDRSYSLGALDEDTILVSLLIR